MRSISPAAATASAQLPNRFAAAFASVCSPNDAALYASAKRLFGTWKTARQAAGFPVPASEFYTKDETLLQIIELYEQERPLTYSSHNDEKLRRSAKKHEQA